MTELGWVSIMLLVGNMMAWIVDGPYIYVFRGWWSAYPSVLSLMIWGAWRFLL